MRILSNHLRNAFLIIICVSFACSSSDKGENLIKIGGTKIDMAVPEHFKQYDINSLNELIHTMDTSESVLTLRSVSLLMDDDNTTKVFFDTLDYNNYITLKKGPKIPFSTNIIEELSNMTKESILKTFGFLGTKVVIKERALKSGERRYIKMKFKLILDNSAFYQTNYLVEGMAETIGINLISNKEDDFESMITSLKVK